MAVYPPKAEGVTSESLGEGILIVGGLTDGEHPWEIWCGASGTDIVNAHLIGWGETREQAVADAVVYLRKEITALVPGTVAHPWTDPATAPTPPDLKRKL